MPSNGKRALQRLVSPIGRVVQGHSLGVLCYHRVVDEVEPGLFPELASASPAMFKQQLDLLEERYDIIGEAQLLGWLHGRNRLPPKPVLITFDDGYKDNYEHAFPILRDRGLPATLFLATRHMDTGELLWWDLASALITRSARTEVEIPLLGARALADPKRRSGLVWEWVETAKKLPNRARLEALDALPDSLGVSSIPTPPRVSMTWDQARAMAGHGISFGGHTSTHPILSRLAESDVEAEVAAGLDRIRQELGTDVNTFAYPNGGPTDFDVASRRAVADHGISIAFSLLSGPALHGEVRRDPFAVRRLYVGARDDPERLDLKLLGWSRVTDMARNRDRARPGPGSR